MEISVSECPSLPERHYVFVRTFHISRSRISVSTPRP
jgi:hypothetical protein